MFYFLQGLALTFLNACGFATVKSRPDTTKMENVITKSFYDFTLTSLDGKEEISFDRYKGKKVLLVNVASKCGLTPQYKDLQELHDKYGDKLVILGFPANNFMGQEPGKNEDIAEFCQKNYGVSFQMFSKISVKGSDQHPLYQWLTKKELNGWNEQQPDWNFAKYLVNEKGELVKFFPARTLPLSNDILEAIK
jgi:glutathione peroxidase